MTDTEERRLDAAEAQNKALRHALGVARRAIRNGPEAYGGKAAVMKLCGDVLDSIKRPEETNRGRAALAGGDEQRQAQTPAQPHATTDEGWGSYGGSDPSDDERISE